MSKKTEKFLIGLLMVVALYIAVGGLVSLSEMVGVSESSALYNRDPNTGGGGGPGSGRLCWNGWRFYYGTC